MAEMILVVDDETEIADLVEVYLKNEGYLVQKATCAAEALRITDTQPIALALLDVMLPDMDGFALCRKIRENHLFPIIMLTAKTEDTDKITGLTLGADDYITKPFEPTELVARVEAVLRRCGKAQGTLAAFDVVLDPAARRVTRSGTPLHLTPREFDLLEVLLRNRGIVLYREVLYERVWGLDAEYDSRTLDLHIQRLRKKLGWKNEIRTVFRVGYVLERGE